MHLSDFAGFKTTFTVFLVLLIICIGDQLFLPHPSWLCVLGTAVLGLWSLVLFVSERRAARTQRQG